MISRDRERVQGHETRCFAARLDIEFRTDAPQEFGCRIGELRLISDISRGGEPASD